MFPAIIMLRDVQVRKVRGGLVSFAVERRSKLRMSKRDGEYSGESVAASELTGPLARVQGLPGTPLVLHSSPY